MPPSVRTSLPGGGRGSAWQSAAFGTQRSWVQIPPPRLTRGPTSRGLSPRPDSCDPGSDGRRYGRSGCRQRPPGAGVTRYVIGPDVAMRLAEERVALSDEHQILAPTLLRSQVLSSLYQAVQRGELTKKDADERLNYLRGLRIRLLGDRVLQRVAWKIADELGWPDTFDAEYVALTQLQADAFVTLDKQLAGAVTELVMVAPID